MFLPTTVCTPRENISVLDYCILFIGSGSYIIYCQIHGQHPTGNVIS